MCLFMCLSKFGNNIFYYYHLLIWQTSGLKIRVSVVRFQCAGMHQCRAFVHGCTQIAEHRMCGSDQHGWPRATAPGHHYLSNTYVVRKVSLISRAGVLWELTYAQSTQHYEFGLSLATDIYTVHRINEPPRVFRRLIYVSRPRKGASVFYELLQVRSEYIGNRSYRRHK